MTSGRLTIKLEKSFLDVRNISYNLIIIAIKKPGGDMLFNPSYEAAIMPDDTVIAVGELENLQKLEKLLNPQNG
jgi:voltage-gated potassium channel